MRDLPPGEEFIKIFLSPIAVCEEQISGNLEWTDHPIVVIC
jgi:hypothetical protein